MSSPSWELPASTTKTEPIKELEAACNEELFQTIWPQNSADLLQFINIIRRGSAGSSLTGIGNAVCWQYQSAE